MKYLTLEEVEMFFDEVLEESAAIRAVRLAEDHIDRITRYFYDFNDYTNDYEWRKERFKKAILYQTKHILDTDFASSYELANRPNSVSLGRTSLNYNSFANNRSNSFANTTTDEVYYYLESIGLLNRGV